MNVRPYVLTSLALALPMAAHALDRDDAELAMTQAVTAVQSAERADAASFAPPDLATAHDMLSHAQLAYDGHHWTESVFAAENARADADLAAARSREHRAEQATAEVERSVQALRDQLGVTTGDLR
jgi:hypothetical protein